MQPERLRTRQDLYREFLEFVRQDIQRERRSANRRMFSVLLWCFLFPALLSVVILVLIKAGVLARSTRAYLDWMILVFPITYSLYILGSEVLTQMPMAFRRGGVANALEQSIRAAEWREQVSESMSRSLSASTEDWHWILMNFQVDLRSMQHRTKYLTALAGAVFFLLMHGIDSLGGEETAIQWGKNPLMGWLETSSNDISQLVGLMLFLVLLYLSGNQTYQALKRYQDCLKLKLTNQQSN
jgi:hypothetical protein